MADVSRPTLGETGQIFVTYAAARRFIEPGGFKEHETEAARRTLTELLLDAKQAPNSNTWRTRKRSTKLDISAVVELEGRLLVVTYVEAQPYDPPSRTSAARRGTRGRFPDDLAGEATGGRSAPGGRASAKPGRRGTRRP